MAHSYLEIFGVKNKLSWWCAEVEFSSPQPCWGRSVWFLMLEGNLFLVCFGSQNQGFG